MKQAEHFQPEDIGHPIAASAGQLRVIVRRIRGNVIYLVGRLSLDLSYDSGISKDSFQLTTGVNRERNE